MPYDMDAYSPMDDYEESKEARLATEAAEDRALELRMLELAQKNFDTRTSEMEAAKLALQRSKDMLAKRAKRVQDRKALDLSLTT